jgi:hypothetical protein
LGMVRSRDELAASIGRLSQMGHEVTDLRKREVAVRLVPKAKDRSADLIGRNDQGTEEEALFAVGELSEIDWQNPI